MTECLKWAWTQWRLASDIVSPTNFLPTLCRLYYNIPSTPGNIYALLFFSCSCFSFLFFSFSFFFSFFHAFLKNHLVDTILILSLFGIILGEPKAHHFLKLRFFFFFFFNVICAESADLLRGLLSPQTSHFSGIWERWLVDRNFPNSCNFKYLWCILLWLFSLRTCSHWFCSFFVLQKVEVTGEHGILILCQNNRYLALIYK